MAKYDSIGTHYNQTRTADPYLAEQMWHRLYNVEFQRYLDIGCGTGNYTSALHQKGITITGVDPSLKMLDKANAKNPNINWIQGSAENIPFENNSFDAALASLTLHHWDSLYDGFKELNRVLKTGGGITIFTSTKKQMLGYWLNHYFPQMLADSINQMPGREEIVNALSAAGFEISDAEPYFVKPNLQDKFLYAGKHDPSFYLDPNMRQGISSFSSLANTEEVKQGLLHLEADIASGKIDSIIKSFENNLGDYLFISAVKILSVN